MTGKEAEEIYWTAYRAASGKAMGVSRVDQSGVVRAAWDAVVEAFNVESDREWALRYLAMQDVGAMGRH